MDSGESGAKIDNQTWLIDAGHDIIEKKRAQGREALTPREVSVDAVQAQRDRAEGEDRHRLRRPGEEDAGEHQRGAEERQRREATRGVVPAPSPDRRLGTGLRSAVALADDAPLLARQEDLLELRASSAARRAAARAGRNP